MKLRIALIAGAIGLSSFAPAIQAEPHSIADDAKAFGTREFLRQADVSPSGKKVLALFSAKGAGTTANVIDVATGNATRVAVTDGKPAALRSCSFAGEQHVVCTYGGMDHIGITLVPFSRMFAVRTDGTKMRRLGVEESDRAAYAMLSDAAVIDWMRGEEGKLLLERVYVPDAGKTGHLTQRNKDGLGVDLMDLDTGKSRTVEPPRGNVIGYMTDGRGKVRVQKIGNWDAEGQESGFIEYRFREPGSDDWLALGSFDTVTRQGLHPLAIDPDRNLLFALQRVNGRDALFQVSLDAGKSSQLLAKNDRVDIDDVVTIGRQQRVVGYTYATDKRQVAYFDPQYDKLHDALQRTLKGSTIDFEAASSDAQHLLIRSSTDTNPGAFFLYSAATRSMLEVGKIRPELDGRELATMKSVVVPAPDGANIPAYLTLPVGGNAKNLPAVVLPHGGPSARDEWGFDWLVQFLAARGYAVIQPQFRGSDGYGDAWLNKNGFQNWRTSIGDVTAAAKYLVSSGIADPNRIAIMGWSYGGYAALQSAAVEPTLYRAAVAIAPVTDLAMAESEHRGWSDEDLVKRIIGTGPHLIDGSPLKQASKIKVPVLLVHGTTDANVSVRESEAMLSALQRNGTSASMLKFDGLDHQLDDSDARIRMLTAAGELLDRTIGH